jgi:hypothetical protein
MKQGLSINDLAQKVYAESQRAKDYVASTNMLEMDDAFNINVQGIGSYKPTELAHRQMAERLSIPFKYYQKMQTEAPDLLATNVNKWFKKTPEKRLVRTMDAEQPYMRAFLSDRYRPYDNFLVMEGALPVLMQHADLQVMSSEVTENRLYVQAVNKSLQAEIRVGDVVQAGIVLSNSEVGLGSIRVETLIYRLVCMNGAIRPESIRKNHTGKRLGLEDEVSMLYANDTILADNKAFMLRVRDMMNFAFQSEKFLEAVDLMKQSTERQITGTVQDVIETVTTNYGFNTIEKDSILKQLIQGADLTQYGLANAVTATANDVDLPYDRVIELERIGGDIFEMNNKAWASIN